ncbi:MAG TPA: TonB-dependent receptor [Rhizomicrobium sp.]|nr:TonB-dependent receptor [Rhizomicrobium sp.]
MLNRFKTVLIGTTSVAVIASSACAQDFNIPRGDLKIALDAYMKQADIALMYPPASVSGIRSQGARGDLPVDVALAKILAGTGFSTQRTSTGAIGIVRGEPATAPTVVAQASPRMAAAAGIESVVVTSSKIKGDIQTVPIAITALSQEQLTARQIAGGPDLVKEVPNLTFSKTNFTGYNIQIRGIGTQAISVTTDPAVAVAFNDTPFIRNHFFEQEFFDVSQVEVLRGPQGTLYGRNATAGVVNVISAKPTDQFEAMASADIGNYHNRRFEGMVNIPVVGDKLDLRVAGEWTKRDGYSFNETTNAPIDGRDLWSSRVSLRWKPVESVTADLIWEHFSENDDRLRSGKQLCKTDFGPGASSLTDTGKLTAADGSTVTVPAAQGTVFNLSTAYFSQGCLPASLYSKDSFEVPNGFSLPFVSGAAFVGLLDESIDPYGQTRQSTNLRDIQSAIEPKYLAKNDTVELNASWNISPELMLFSDSGYNNDFLWSTEDYNRFDTSAGIFKYPTNKNFILPDPNSTGGIFCDPQLGCSDRLVVQDLATERSWQLSQEFRLASNFQGPLNFSVGGNFLHYETGENYYVFSNTFTMISLGTLECGRPYVPNVTDQVYCLPNGLAYNYDPKNTETVPTEQAVYVDPHSLNSLNNEGHNYFISNNPYVLNSYAGFGEAYYNVTPDLKLTAGLRWTDDEKHFIEIPSELLVKNYGYPSIGNLDQKWNQWTGRFVANWSPKLDFTDQSMFYASYARGYKAGGANPPGPILVNADNTNDASRTIFPVHPLDFKPEFIDAYEMGTKNTLLDGGLTLNGDVFFYNYKGYQISQIVDRNSINLNFDATVKGAELEATYEPLPGLKFSFAGGYEDTNINKNQFAIDLMDRTAGVPGWVLMKPSVGESSNCIFPEYVVAALFTRYAGYGEGNPAVAACGIAYTAHEDPITGLAYKQYPTVTDDGPGYPVPAGYPGFDPLSVDPTAPANVNNGLGLPPNNGEGFAKPVGGNELPNAPHYTVSLTADYTMPVSTDWAATLHGDFYWQSQSFARVFNDRPYDKIRGYSSVNTALILTDASGWQVMGYVKNIFNATAITGDFLNSDDSGLTTNIFLTDPRLYGIRVTKNFGGGSSDSFDWFSNTAGERPQIWIDLGGSFNQLADKSEPYVPPFESLIPSDLPGGVSTQNAPKASFDWQGSISYQPNDSDWVLKAGVRYGRSAQHKHVHKSLPVPTEKSLYAFGKYFSCTRVAQILNNGLQCPFQGYFHEFTDAVASSSEKHAILDFTLGKDIGIGMFGGSGTLSGGMRVAQFDTKARAQINSDPHYVMTPHIKYLTHNNWNGVDSEKRKFHGIGPEITWDSTMPLLGQPEDGQVAFDWGLNGAILFGRSSAKVNHQTSICRVEGSRTQAHCVYTHTQMHPYSRSRSVTVPNLGGYAGLSMRYTNAKVSFGYRADEFFGAMDGGQDTAKKYNRGFFGPYLNLSLSFGG